MTDKHDLTGKVALVTGASRGIGRAVAIGLAEAGADVAVNFRRRQDDAEQVRSKVESLGRRCIIVRADVSKAGDVARMVEAVESGLGAVAILVNNAGIAHAKAWQEITEADWDETMDVNLKSVFLVTQAVLPTMQAIKWGRIINISSTAAQVGGVIGPHYTASKAGILGLTRSYAALFTKDGITVNAIAPALIETEMIADNPNIRPELIPIGRFGTSEEVAGVVVMLARNAYITGQTMNVNGGRYMS
jgi:3-oxoacyl-[acyl-carrier protein] reductase